MHVIDVCVSMNLCGYVFIDIDEHINTVLLKFRTWTPNQGRRPKLERYETERAEIRRTHSQKEWWNDMDNAGNMLVTWV